VARQGVHEVAWLSPPHEREQLVGRQVEGVQRQAQVLVPDEREEAIGAVSRPLDDDRILPAVDPYLDEARALAQDPDPAPRRLEGCAVGAPRRLERFRRVVEEVEVAADASVG
jgi:hypothetical protein